jgi:serine/threonine protein kinase
LEHIEHYGSMSSSIILNHPKISDFELGKCVGSGKFGEVFICRHKDTKTLYGLKKLVKSTVMEYGLIDQLVTELKILYLCNHPHIIKLYTHFSDDYHIFLLMEYGEGGVLMSQLKQTEKYVANVLDQLINAVQYLHSLRIVHRDIKP